MRYVSYTRTTACIPGDIPANIITEQNEHIKYFAKKHGWKIQEKYSDRKKDSNENEGFDKLLKDGMYRKFDGVIVDSIFRTGRGIGNAREVLYQTFYFAGINFAVVEDDFISVGKTSEEIEEYFRQKYSEWHQKNIFANLVKSTKEGKLAWADVKYGYYLTEEGKLAIDPETAPIVKRMFEMCAEGISPTKIAEIFTKEKILRPLARIQDKEKIEEPYKWTNRSVKDVLSKSVYTGCWKKIVFGEEMEQHNEPIISEEIYEKVQKIIHPNGPLQTKLREKHKYAGMIVDSKYGACFHYRVSSVSWEGYFNYSKKPDGYDKLDHILIKDIDQEVRKVLERASVQADQLKIFLDSEGKILLEKARKELSDEYKNRAFDVAKLEKNRMNCSRNMTQEEFEKSDEGKNYKKRIEDHEKFFKNYSKKDKEIQKILGRDNPWIKLYESYDPKEELTKEFLKKHIVKVIITDFKKVEVQLKEEESIQKLYHIWGLENGKKK